MIFLFKFLIIVYALSCHIFFLLYEGAVLSCTKQEKQSIKINVNINFGALNCCFERVYILSFRCLDF